jgi:two-component system, cell cycle response regulator DivK
MIPCPPPLVLVVDDAKDTRVIYAESLRFRGFRVEEASDGQEALEKVSALAPDVVILDLKLPVIDGCEAARRLKIAPATKAIPIIVLSGHLLEESRQAALAAGADAYLTKPCLPDDLARHIDELLDRRR